MILILNLIKIIIAITIRLQRAMKMKIKEVKKEGKERL